MEFLLGPSPKNQSETSDPTQHEKAPPRRWSSNQVKEFGPLHCTLSLLVRNTDISIFESESDSNEEAGLNPYTIPAKLVEVVPPSDGMHQALFTIDCSKRFIREVGVASFTSLVFHTTPSLPLSLHPPLLPPPSFSLLCHLPPSHLLLLPLSLAPSLPPSLPLQCILTLRESDSTASDAIASTFCFCSWSNQSFSACTIEDLQLQIAAVPSNEIRNYFKVIGMCRSRWESDHLFHRDNSLM